MFKFLNLVVVLLLPFHLQAEPKFERAMILSAGRFSIPMFIGMVDGATDAGYKPDVIIATCGAAYAGAILNALPDPKAHKDFLLSEEFQKMLLVPQTRGKMFGGPNAMFELALNTFIFRSQTIPDIFNLSFFWIPTTPPPSFLDQPFSTNIKTIIVGASTFLKEEDIGKTYEPNKKYFRQIVMSDPETASLLDGMAAPIAKEFPQSRIENKIQAINDFSLSRAARIAIAEPFLINPVTINGRAYMGSYIDLYPTAIAKTIARQVMATYEEDTDRATNGTIIITYGFEPSTRIKNYVREKNIDHWTDISDLSSELEKYGLDYKIEPNGFNASVLNKVPTDITKFRERTISLYNYGYHRGYEGAKSPRQSKSHIRIPLTP